MVPYKGRKLRPGPVQVYRNLNKHGVWYSLRQHGMVIGHAEVVTLLDATFVIQQGGRDRCLREGRKNVHAWVQGTLTPNEADWWGVKVHYRPKDADHFYYNYNNGRFKVNSARFVGIGKDGITAWQVNEW